ncbi:metal-sulfur cluster assembly factor [Magnetospirillum moscoviense]|uniref:Metal-sulfur cluster biosynthetic protein n=1 Tax=Magnetospirillum moscoviense TaxID=1437059 RepID=A0A178MJV6_9PROT|nr:metal-sulfur cluster assembly factor [Magnetospirillum moscoviense]OAN48960.1 metal-sulfur cluster biosynthetic protein [Magnetospirillum moscoviense]
MPTPDDITQLLRAVIDPDVGINIVELGLVESVVVADGLVRVDLIMTTPACPQTGHLQDEAARVIAKAGFDTRVTVLEAPLWQPSRMSALARKSLGWDA